MFRVFQIKHGVSKDFGSLRTNFGKVLGKIL